MRTSIRALKQNKNNLAIDATFVKASLPNIPAITIDSKNRELYQNILLYSINI